MAGWSSEELDTIGGADELRIAPLDGDGTPREPVTIWVVREGDGLYVRSAKGRSGRWYRAARARGVGNVQAGGLDRAVTFVEEADPAVNEAVDAAYRSKYQRYGGTYVDPMVAGEPRETTLALLPR
ncbi:DUF2255 family protein [Streptomyces sp. DSM 44915]|uniref:DUF2255 family protein n=1 Tax=Streptomyces chisholmiae TaxID=3075540 RepID=A0ABU2JY43_9ACTN|nr:DUF2255 family protein [Streptomyces sp. DSM 44915]MDT0269449.1 DUF2255 family protein [Streptomyces sp. DSM 44915]